MKIQINKYASGYYNTPSLPGQMFKSKNELVKSIKSAATVEELQNIEQSMNKPQMQAYGEELMRKLDQFKGIIGKRNRQKKDPGDYQWTAAAETINALQTVLNSNIQEGWRYWINNRTDVAGALERLSNQFMNDAELGPIASNAVAIVGKMHKPASGASGEAEQFLPSSVKQNTKQMADQTLKSYSPEEWRSLQYEFKNRNADLKKQNKPPITFTQFIDDMSRNMHGPFAKDLQPNRVSLPGQGMAVSPLVAQRRRIK